MLGQQDQLDLAARYIKHMRERIEKLKRQKEQAMLNQSSERKMFDKNDETKLPILELRDLGSGIEVMLVSGLNKTFMLYEVISVLEEEGAEVVTASFSTVGDKLFYVVHAQVKFYIINFYHILQHFHLKSLFLRKLRRIQLTNLMIWFLLCQVKISRVGVETTRVKDRLQEFIAPLEIWPEDV